MCHPRDVPAKKEEKWRTFSTIGMNLVSFILLPVVFASFFFRNSVGAVSRVGRKGATKVFKYGRKSPRVPTLTELFPKIQADAGSWLGTKNALYCCAQSANSFSWVLFVSSYTTAIVSPHLPGSFTKLVRTRETFIFYFPNQKQRNYRWVEKTFGMLLAGAIEFAPRIFCFWLVTMYRK